MTENSLPDFDALAATIEQQTASFRELYAVKTEAYHEHCEKISHVAKAPTDRVALEEFLIQVIEDYCAWHETKFRDYLQRIANTADALPEQPGRWLGSLKSGIEPPYWFLAPLLRDHLRNGARRIAHEIAWPDTDVETKTRLQRMRDLQDQQAALRDELAAMRAEAAKVGIELPVVR